MNNPCLQLSIQDFKAKAKELQKTEQDVSDVYVRLGNDFNAAVAAFASFNIDMT